MAFVHNNLGLALEAAGRVDEARAAWRRALEIDGAHAPAAVNLARFGDPAVPGEPVLLAGPAVSAPESGAPAIEPPAAVEAVGSETPVPVAAGAVD